MKEIYLIKETNMENQQNTNLPTPTPQDPSQPSNTVAQPKFKILTSKKIVLLFVLLAVATALVTISLKRQAIQDQKMLRMYNFSPNNNSRLIDNPNLYKPVKLDSYNGPYTPIENLNLEVVNPAAIKIGVETKVKFSVSPKNFLPKVAYIELEQADPETSIYRSLGKLSDDGNNGDFEAEDGIYTIELPIKSDKLGYLQFHFKAEGINGYFYSDPFKVEVSPLNLPNDYQGGISNETINDPELGKIIANKVNIIVKEGTTATRIEEIVKEINGTISGRIAELNVWIIQLPPATDASNIKTAIKKLETYPEIESAMPDSVTTLY